MPARKSKKIDWPDALDLFETALRARRAAPLTILGYTRHVSDLARRLGPDVRPADVTRQALREVQAALLSGDQNPSGRPLAANTVATTVAGWSSFFRFLAREGHVQSDPTADLERPRCPRRPPGTLITPAEAARVLTRPDPLTPDGLRDRAVLDLLFSAGLRNAELRGLDLADVDHKERQLTVRGKGEHVRIVPLTRSAYRTLKQYLDDGRGAFVKGHADGAVALFLTSRGSRLSEPTLRLLVKRHVAAAQVGRRVTPHGFRRGFATALLKSGASLRAIQLLLGHDSLDTTARSYLRLDPADLRKELLLKHPRERLDA